MAVSVKYRGVTIASAKNGQTVEIDTKGHSFSESIFVRSYGAGEGGGGSYLFKKIVPRLTVTRLYTKINLGNISPIATTTVNQIKNLTIKKGA